MKPLIYTDVFCHYCNGKISIYRSSGAKMVPSQHKLRLYCLDHQRISTRTGDNLLKVKTTDVYDLWNLVIRP